MELLLLSGLLFVCFKMKLAKGCIGKEAPEKPQRDPTTNRQPGTSKRPV